MRMTSPPARGSVFGVAPRLVGWLTRFGAFLAFFGAGFFRAAFFGAALFGAVAFLRAAAFFFFGATRFFFGAAFVLDLALGFAIRLDGITATSSARTSRPGTRRSRPTPPRRRR
jgi:hypothetical protein